MTYAQPDYTWNQPQEFAASDETEMRDILGVLKEIQERIHDSKIMRVYDDHIVHDASAFRSITDDEWQTVAESIPTIREVISDFFESDEEFYYGEINPRVFAGELRELDDVLFDLQTVTPSDLVPLDTDDNYEIDRKNTDDDVYIEKMDYVYNTVEWINEEVPAQFGLKL